MDKIQVSFGTLAKLSGISVDELKSKLTKKGEDGKLEPIDKQKAIDDTIVKGYESKLDQVIEGKSEDYKKAGRLEVYKKIEDKAKEEFGVTMSWNDDGFGKIAAKLSEGTKEAIKDVTKTEEYIKMFKAKTEEIKGLKSEYETEIKGIHEGNLKSEVKRYVKGLVTKEDHKLTKYDDAVTENLVKLMTDQLYDIAKEKEISFKNEDGTFKLLNKDGKPYMDPDSQYENPSFDQFALGVAKKGFFPEMQGKDITSGAPGGQSSGAASNSNFVFTNKKGEQETYVIPTMKTEEELANFTTEMMTSGRANAEQIIEQAGKVFYKEE